MRPRRGVTLAEQLAASSNLRDLLKLRDGDGLFASIYLGAEQSLARINPSQLFHFLFAHKSKLRLFVSAELPFFRVKALTTFLYVLTCFIRSS